MSLQDTATAPAETTTTTTTPAPTAKAPATPPKDAPKAPAAPAPKAEPETKQAAPAERPKADPKPSTATSIFDDEDEDGAEPAETTPETKAAETTAEDGEKGKAAFVPPDNWRELIANGDDKHLAELKRFASFDTWMKSQRALRQKLSSGEYKKADAWDDTWDDERKAEYRKEHGIPAKATEYQLPEVKGKEWTEQDKAAMAPFLERLHAKNASPAVVQEALSYYAEALTMVDEHKVTQDREHKLEIEDELRPEWGADYRANVNLIKRVLDDPEVIPGGLKGLGGAISRARTEDGRRLINTKEMAQFLAGLARDRYGEGGMLPGVEVKQMDDREAEIRKIMREDINRYYREKNAKGQTLEAELAEIRARKAGTRRAA